MNKEGLLATIMEECSGLREQVSRLSELVVRMEAERDTLHRVLDRVLAPRWPVEGRVNIALANGQVIALTDWRDLTIEMDCNNSDRTQFFLTREHCPHMLVVPDDYGTSLHLSKDNELLILGASCITPDVTVTITYNARPVVCLGGMPLMVGEPLVTGPIHVRELLSFRVEVIGPRRPFKVFIRTLYRRSKAA